MVLTLITSVVSKCISFNVELYEIIYMVPHRDISNKCSFKITNVWKIFINELHTFLVCKIDYD